ncbi:MAG TPA: ribonuclease D [Rhodospirillaceae bacterium]|nr:ribonuclease D [Rhodospirillaceae bacterium]HAA91346.1 ribonuclease D [Rhodospirillaceae bacterium]HAT35951.1 ribonuclease D [Rhodospirillaceae bacterium]
MSVHFHRGDLPKDLDLGNVIAVDSETMGLNLHRDRLCVVQLSGGDGDAHVVQIPQHHDGAPNLVKLLSDPKTTKLFHFARFDVAVLKYYLDCDCQPVCCTKIASRLVRTFTDRHGLKDLCKDLLGIDISKQQQSSDWGADELSEAQMEYAASDVLHLHQIWEKLEEMLVREGRMELAQAAYDFLPTRAALDIAGFENDDIFAHH